MHCLVILFDFLNNTQTSTNNVDFYHISNEKNKTCIIICIKFIENIVKIKLKFLMLSVFSQNAYIYKMKKKVAFAS